MVEFALIAPILILLLFGVIDFGRLIYVYATLNQAVNEGARTAIRDSAVLPSNADVQTEVRRHAVDVRWQSVPLAPITSAIPPANRAGSTSPANHRDRDSPAPSLDRRAADLGAAQRGLPPPAPMTASLRWPLLQLRADRADQRVTESHRDQRRGRVPDRVLMASFRPRPSQQGQAIVLVALVLTVLFGFLGLAIDGGRGYLDRRHIQGSVDAAALAAAYDYMNNSDYGMAELAAVNQYIDNERLSRRRRARATDRRASTARSAIVGDSDHRRRRSSIVCVTFR
jgi:Flp pilus assembly protein TadG